MKNIRIRPPKIFLAAASTMHMHMHQRLRFVALAVLALACAAGPVRAETGAEMPVSFRADVAPLLLEHCVACHNAKNAEGGYRVDTFAELIKPGDSGEPPIGDATAQLGELLRRLTTEDAGERMPAEREPLTAEAIAVIHAWLRQGAAFDAADPHQALALVVPAPRHPEPPESYPAAPPITAVAFTPAGTELLVGGYHEITVWSVAKASLVRRIANLGQRIFAIELSPDGHHAAVACGDPGRSGEVRLVELASGEVQAVLARSADVALDAAFHPSRAWLAIAGADSRIQIIDTETSQTVRTLASHADWVTAVAWSPDGNRLASASRDGSAKVYDAVNGEVLTSYTGHTAAVRGLMFTPDGQHLLSTGSDQQLHRWEAASGKRLAATPLGGEGFRLSPLGQQHALVPVSNQRLLRVALENNETSETYTGLDDWVVVAAWHGDTNRIAAAALNGQVAIWDANQSAPIQLWIAKP